MLGVKLVYAPREQNVNLNGDVSLVFLDKRRYWSLVIKFIYLIVTKHDIKFLVGIMRVYGRTQVDSLGSSV